MKCVRCLPVTTFILAETNNGKEWDANPTIQEFKKKKNNNHDLQTYFNMKLIPMLKKHNKRLMGWEEIMTRHVKRIIHAWRGGNEGVTQVERLLLLQNGYNTVLSNGYYIDLMLSVDSHYLNDPLPKIVLSPEEKARILGGRLLCGANLRRFEHRFKYGPELPQLKDYGQMIRLLT
jgi:hexosaminidase